MSTPIEVLADDFVISINTGTEVSPTWTPIQGLKSHRLGSETKEVDAANRSTRGWGQTRSVRRGQTLTMGGNFFEDPDDGARDPGQAAVETLAEQIMPDDLGWFCLETPFGATTYFQATAKMGDVGGDLDSLCEWNATLSMYGAPSATYGS